MDVSEHPEVAQKYNVMTIPTVILEDGTVLSNLSDIKEHFSGS